MARYDKIIKDANIKAAEIGGYDRSAGAEKAAGVLHAVKALFPHAADYSQVSYWSGLRPMTPDGPLISVRPRSGT